MNDAQVNCGHCPGRQQLAAINVHTQWSAPAAGGRFNN